LYQPANPIADFPDRRGDAVDLGFAAPLDAGSRRHALDERRRVSLRWLSATILIGLCGGGLMSFAIVAALDSQSDFAEQPELVANQAPTPALTAQAVLRKGDKLVRKVDLLNARQSFKAATISRIGNREVIKVHAFARVSAPLVLASTDFKDEVPSFNPMKIMADAGGERQADPASDDDTGVADVSLVTKDLAAYGDAPLSGVTLGKDEAQRQAVEVLGQTQRSLRVPLPTPQSMLALGMRAPAGIPALSYAPPAAGPFSGLDVRMVPENVTAVPRLELPAGQSFSEEKIITIRRGQTGEAALQSAGASAEEAKAAIANLTARPDDVSEGKQLKLLFAQLDASDPAKHLVRVMLYKDDETLEAMTAVNDSGKFVAIAAADAGGSQRQSASDDDDDSSDRISLFASLYETGLKNEIPKPVLQDLVRIFSYDLDFQRRVAGGDSFDVLYAEDDDGDIHKGDVLYAAIQVGGETRHFYRFTASDDASIDYYDQNGRSAKKFLLRKPVVNAQMRSPFGVRRHPVLGYTKMHTGVDWAAPVGTPILAAGDGVVIKAGWDSGYGKHTEIQHINGYVTTYSHQSNFAKGIQPGVRVRQGQVIGYIGSTGLATGPHVHYEVVVNDHFVDPNRIKLPRGRELDGRMLADFRRERARIDEILQKSPNQTRVVAQRQ
jgi:murein DD-endopeptidase MepM/ murein hydrolase activator NlpD